MKATLFHIQGSPNCAVARLAFERKGVPVREVELPIGAHAGILRVLGFRSGGVPAARIDGRRVQGSSQIMRALDAAIPQPPLFTSPAVEEAERWGETVAQVVPRRILGKFVRRAPQDGATWSQGGLVGSTPAPIAKALTGPVLRFQAWRLKVGAEPELHDALRDLGPMLDHVAALLDEGTLSATDPTAADFQIAPQVRLLLNLEDLADAVEARPGVAEWARALVPHYPGRVRPVLRPEERALVA